MKLFLNAASPYARLVRTVLVETGLQAETELHYADPWNAPVELLSRNPVADLTVAVAFEYIDFRLPDVRWRKRAPRLERQVESLSERPSLSTTRPQ